MVCKIDAMVNKLKPRYMGFLLNLYKPLFLNSVFFSGIPSVVEDPKFSILIIEITRPMQKIR